MRKTKIWKLENDFYNFAAKHFASVKKVVIIDWLMKKSTINNHHLGCDGAEISRPAVLQLWEDPTQDKVEQSQRL